MIHFSALLKMFFDDIEKIIGHKPSDLVPVPDEHFKAVQEQLTQGKVLDVDASGMPVAVDPAQAEAQAPAASATVTVADSVGVTDTPPTPGA